MDNLLLLDTTLRDGSYVTDFQMDEAIKRPIIDALSCAGIEIIECGFIEHGRAGTDIGSAVYGSEYALNPYIAPKKPESLRYIFRRQVLPIGNIIILKV